VLNGNVASSSSSSWRCSLIWALVFSLADIS